MKPIAQRPAPSTPVVLTALWLVVAVPFMTAVLLAWVEQRDVTGADELQRGRVNALDARAAQLEVDVGQVDEQLEALDVAALRAELAETRRRLESLCLALATVARTASGAERLAGDTEWCPVSMPKRTGEARIWRKHGWGVTDAEAAKIRARINPTGATR